MLRIIEETETSDSVTLRLDGRLVGQWVELLRANCESVFQRNHRLILDLKGVSFADHRGVQLLQQFLVQQITLLNCSPFLREQIHQRVTAPLTGPASPRA